MQLGASTFDKHRLVQVGPGRIEFRTTLQFKLCYVLTLGFFVALPIILYYVVASSDSIVGTVFHCFMAAVGGIIWLVLVLIFVHVFISDARRRVFDRAAGYYWRGRKLPDSVRAGAKSKRHAPLAEVHALQIMPIFLSYRNAELNLVLKDASRVRVVGDRHYTRIRTAASLLSDLLGVPVWDGVAESPILRGRKLMTSIGEEAEPLDTSRFDDPVADRTDWLPVVEGATRLGGCKFAVEGVRGRGGCKLAEVGPGRLVVKRTDMLTFPVTFALFGLVTAFLGTGVLILAELPPGILGVLLRCVLYIVSIGLITTSVVLYRRFCKPVVFDKAAGHFRPGYRHSSVAEPAPTGGSSIPLAEIHALQVIAKAVSTSISNFDDFEVNVVLKDASRINIMGAGDLAATLQSAQTIGEFLGVPVWDASDRPIAMTFITGDSGG